MPYLSGLGEECQEKIVILKVEKVFAPGKTGMALLESQAGWYREAVIYTNG